MSLPTVNPDLLCSATVHKTKVPLIPQPLSEPIVPPQTVDVTSCSEFRKFTLPVTHFDATQKLHFVLDGQHQPLIFTVGKDKRFYCIHHVSGSSWKSYDITSGTADATVASFHVIQHENNKVAAAVAIRNSTSSELADLYYAKPFDATVDGFDPSKVEFVKIAKNNDALAISAVTLSAADTTMSSCFIIVGTSASDSKVGTNYVVTPGSDEGNWKTLKLHEDSPEVLKTLAVTLRPPYNGCMATLYKQNSSTVTESDAGSGLACSSTDANQTYNITLELKDVGGGARDIAMVISPNGRSDLYVAGLKGIGYYASEKLTKDPTVILSDISFKQIVAAEKSQITAFAVSTAGDLYHIEGTRDKKGKVTLTTTGLPVRSDVGFLSTQYNASVDASEAVYVTTNNTRVRHLVRDPTTTMWAEQVVFVQWDRELTTYTGLETLVSFRGSSGAGVGTDFLVALSSSELTYALVNDKSYRLGPTPITVRPDSVGSIRVAMQADLSISGPTLHFTVQGSGTSKTVKVDPRQRITRNWSKYSSGSDLKGAKTVTGEDVFPNTTIPDSTFDDIVVMLGQASMALESLEPGASLAKSQQASNPTPAASYFHREQPTLFAAPGLFDWVAELIDTAEHVVGDVVEWVVHAAESAVSTVEDVVKVGIAFVKGVLTFGATIAGKAYRWVLDKVGTLVRTVIACLKTNLGLDSTRFFALFGFYWDHENLIKTQKIIANSATKGAIVLKKIIGNNISEMKAAMKNCRSHLGSQMKDERIAEQDEWINWKSISHSISNSPIGQIYDFFTNNPIIRETKRLISWLINAVMSVANELFSLPGVAALHVLGMKLMTSLRTLMTEEVDNVIRYLNDIIIKLKELFAGQRNIAEFFSVLLSDTFWTLFDAMDDVIDAFLDILPSFVDAVLDMWTGTINIPGPSAFWKAFNDTEFSLLNVFSMALSQGLYLFTMMWKGQLPFDFMPDWSTFLPGDPNTVKLSEVDAGISSASDSSKAAPRERFASRGPTDTNQLRADATSVYLLEAADNSTADSTGLSDSQRAALWDYFFTCISSVATWGLTLFSLPDDMMPSVKYSVELQDIGHIPFISDAPIQMPNSPLLPSASISWTQLACGGVSLIFDVVLAFRADNGHSQAAKLIAAGLTTVELIRIAIEFTGIGRPLLSREMMLYGPFLPPIGAVFNAAPGFRDYNFSTKQTRDQWAFGGTVLMTVGATLDIVAVVGAKFEQPEVAGVSLAGALGCSIASFILTGPVYLTT